MPEFDVQMPNGKTTTFCNEDGVTFKKTMVTNIMPAGDLKLQLQWLKETEIKDDDVIICAYPKAGTHWLWEVLSMLQKQKADYSVKVKETVMIEFCKKEDVASAPSPRVLNTHMLARHLPQQALDKKTKIIHVLRNPKDILVSLYHHMQAMQDSHGEPKVEFKQFLKLFLGDSKLVPLCSYFKYIKEYEEFRQSNPDQLIHVYYEDMKRNPEREIKRIADFIGKPANEELIKSVAKQCDFAALKKANDEIKDDFTKKLQADSTTSIMYRKGIIGDWKTHLTVAENEAYDQIIERELKDSNIKFQYE